MKNLIEPKYICPVCGCLSFTEFPIDTNGEICPICMIESGIEITYGTTTKRVDYIRNKWIYAGAPNFAKSLEIKYFDWLLYEGPKIIPDWDYKKQLENLQFVDIEKRQSEMPRWRVIELQAEREAAIKQKKLDDKKNRKKFLGLF
jgi:hypothetical protein